MTDLSDTVALVTGASRGVGRGIAVELGAAGATVYVTGRSVGEDTTDGLAGTVGETAVAVTERGGTGVSVRCDHADDRDVAALFDRIGAEQGRLDLLVNNVWGGYEGHDDTFDAPFWEQPTARWDAMFDAGVRAHFTTSRLAAPLLFEAGDDRHGRGGDDGQDARPPLVVGISAGDGEKYRGSVPYDVAKTAVDRLGKAMAHELRPHGVASVVVYPGFTRTERVLATFEVAGEEPPPEAHTPEFVGRAVVALAGDPAVLERSGGVYRVAELAREYGFTDTDGSRPEPFELDTEPL